MLQLIRTISSVDGVFGKLHVPHGEPHLLLHTVEDDDKNNEPGESCIPAGRYKLHRTIYHKGGYETFEIMNVPNRQRILIHRANTEEDIKGCVGVGMRMGTLRVRDEDDPAHPYITKTSIVESRRAHDLFMQAMEGIDEDEIQIEWALT